MAISVHQRRSAFNQLFKFLIKCITISSLMLLINSNVTFAAEKNKESGSDTITQHAHGGVVGYEYPKPDYSKGNKKLIEKGEYLVKAGDCIACHTAPNDPHHPFAGGLAIKTPFGTIYTPNITPDKKTGIGKWTDEDLIRAMHDGVSPDGSNYFPAFPYTSFNKVTADDIKAIKAYLFAIPAVSKKNKPLDMPWPYSWRFLQYGWKVLFFYFRDNHVYKYNPDRSAEWNRGAYLVQGLGHCAECHTPRNFLGAMKTDQYLGGAYIDGYYAPNITSYRMKNLPEDKIIKVFDQEKMLSGGPVQGPMLEVDHDSLEYMTKKDLRAIAAYLKTVPAIVPQKPKITGSGAGAGKALYDKVCATCHATGAAGAPKFGNKTDWDPILKKGQNKILYNAIHGIGSMPPKGTCTSCSNKQIKDAVDYMLDSLKSGGKGASKAAASAPKKLTLADGKKIYTQQCAVCHNNGTFGAPEIGDKKVWAPLIKQNMDVLFENTLRTHANIPGMKASTSETEAAVKYMVNQSKTSGDYSLW